jgi:hypothetical protein
MYFSLSGETVDGYHLLRIAATMPAVNPQAADVPVLAMKGVPLSPTNGSLKFPSDASPISRK